MKRNECEEYFELFKLNAMREIIAALLVVIVVIFVRLRIRTLIDYAI